MTGSAPAVKIPRAHAAVVATLTLLAAATTGCDHTATPDAKVVELVAPDLVDSNAIEIAAGDTLEIRWTPAEPDFAVWLVYRDRATLSEEIILSDAMGGTHAWVVPAELTVDSLYEVREYDPADGSLIALSPPLLITGDAGTTGLPAGSPCTADSECNDGLYCNGAETCAGGVCSNGYAPCDTGVCDEATEACLPAPCATDDNCNDGEACADNLCIPLNPGSNGLAGFAVFAESGAPVDFEETLTVGEVLALTAPTPAVATARLLDGACSCGWSVVPENVGSFGAPDACSTGFTLASSNAFALRVDVTCPTAAMRYVQTGAAADPPPNTPAMEVLAEEATAPYVVRFNLRLKDDTGAVIPAGVSIDNFTIAENGAPVDFAETNRFVVPGENLPLRIILVLDYTSSMAEAGAIGAMVAAAADLVKADHFTATHQIGVVEFHDRTDEGEGYRLVVPLTPADSAGKTAIVAGMPRPDAVEAGLSRAWDAVELALTTLGAVERQTGEVQAVVFLTDGRDTTSTAEPTTLATSAAASAVRLYPIGFGDVADTQDLLQSMATTTGGAYFPAADADALAAIFAQIAADLRGQWNLSYLTPRNSGNVKVTLTFAWQGKTITYDTSFEAGSLAGDIHEGRFTILDRKYNSYTNRTSFVLHAQYMPRNIDRFRFIFAHSAAQFTLQSEGGLTPASAGWSLTALGAGEYLLLNSAPLEYGAFGNLGAVSVPGDVPTLQMTHDDTIYATAPQVKSFAFLGDLWSAPYTLNATSSSDTLGEVVVTPNKSGYGFGEVVKLSAVATGGTFTKWSGASDSTDATIQITMNGDKAVVAQFN